MDKRINYLIGLDTETCNGIVTGDKLDLSQSLVYDLGWVITDKLITLIKFLLIGKKLKKALVF